MARTESKINDLCVICGKTTECHKDQNINERKYYIEGAGQLCKNCYEKLY